jgi:hypothetical protein
MKEIKYKGFSIDMVNNGDVEQSILSIKQAKEIINLLIELEE